VKYGRLYKLSLASLHNIVDMDPSPIDFSQPGKVLTVVQRGFYDKHGYIVIRNCVPRHEIERYLWVMILFLFEWFAPNFRRRFYEICEGKDVPPDMTVARDVSNPQLASASVEKQVSKIRDMNHDKVLFDYCKYPTVSFKLTILVFFGFLDCWRG
jgi:phytanoyl-CoA hydroxylase